MYYARDMGFIEPTTYVQVNYVGEVFDFPGLPSSQSQLGELKMRFWLVLLDGAFFFAVVEQRTIFTPLWLVTFHLVFKIVIC